MSINTYEFRATTPNEAWLQEAARLLEKTRLEEIFGQRRDLYAEDNPEGLIIDIEALKAETVGGETLVRTESVDKHLTVDPGELHFAGQYNLGPLGTWIAFTHESFPDRQDWYWPITGAGQPYGDESIDLLSEGDNILVAMPADLGRQVTATLIIPTLDDAGDHDMGITEADRSRVGDARCLMPTTWVLETLAKGLLASRS